MKDKEENIPTPKEKDYSNITRMTEDEFKKVSRLVYDNFGINLNDSKKILAESRLNSLLRKKGIPNFSDYLKLLETDKSGQELVELANKISTNHTYFYREEAHFHYLKSHVLPEIFRNNKEEEIRIWSAPCSSGEEAYTIAMTVHSFMQENSLLGRKRIKILGTDISINALETAKKGIYSKEEIQILPKAWQTKYFKSINNMEVVVVPEIRNSINFGRLNFIDSQWPFKKKFHIIFCRNVMIYFDTPTKINLVRKFYNQIESGSYFIISLSESLPLEVKTLFQQTSSSIFKKP